MNQKEKMLAGLPYKAWLDGLEHERLLCKKKIYQFNLLPPDSRGQIPALLRDLLGKTGEAVMIEPPFHCDYGWNIEVGDNFFANYNLTILDVGKVVIGDNVWIGGNAVILPGVTIGSGVVIGAGSVVAKSIPDNVIAAGNPCRVIREITEEDRRYYFKRREFDEEAWAEITGGTQA